MIWLRAASGLIFPDDDGDDDDANGDGGDDSDEIAMMMIVMVVLLVMMMMVVFDMYVECFTLAGDWEVLVLVDQTCTLLAVLLVDFLLLRVHILQAIGKPWIL